MILATIRNLWTLGRQVSDTSAGMAAAKEAYASGTALPGVVLAYTGTTVAAADNLALEPVLSVLEAIWSTAAGSAQTLEFASQVLGNAALELRELEGLIARLRGGAPLREVLEGDAA